MTRARGGSPIAGLQPDARSRSADEGFCRAREALLRIFLGGDRARGLDGLDLDRDLDLVADEHAAGLEELVPRQAEVLAVDRRRGGEAGAIAPPRILDPTRGFDLDDDRLRGAADGQ